MKSSLADAPPGTSIATYQVDIAGNIVLTNGVPVALIKGGAGVFNLYFHTFRLVTNAVVAMASAGGFCITFVNLPNQVTVYTYNTAAVATDAPFSLTVTGFPKT